MKTKQHLIHYSTLAFAIGWLSLATAWADFTNYYALPGFPLAFTATATGTYSNWSFNPSWLPGHAQFAVSINGTSAVFSELGSAGDDDDTFWVTSPSDGSFQFSWQGDFDGFTECGFWSNGIPAVLIVPDYTSGFAEGTFSSPVKKGDKVGWYMYQEDDDIRVDWQITNFSAPQPSGLPLVTMQPTNQTAMAGSTVSFSVTAIGAPPLTYQWSFNTTNLADATDAILTLTNLQLNQSGSYAVLVTNLYGSTNSDVATLTIYALPPFITVQPLTQGAVAGGTATFTVTADGSPPMGYQWFKDGLPITGATGTNFTLTGASTNNLGVYSVQVTNQFGSVVSFNAFLTLLTPLHEFTISTNDARTPMQGLVLDGDVLYGASYAGGRYGNGTVYKVNSDGTGFTLLHSFTATAQFTGINSDGAYPFGSWNLLLADDTLYGTAQAGGTNASGTVFKVSTNGTGFAVLHTFEYPTGSPATNRDGSHPQAGLVLAGNTLYGSASDAGRNGSGVIYKVNTDGTGFAVLKHFSALSSSTNADGANPQAILCLSGNTLYGTARAGGAANRGTVFKINTDGNGFAVLKHFLYLDPDGWHPTASLVLNSNTLYGTAIDGGSSGGGTVFKVDTDGNNFAVLHDFLGGNADGESPEAGLTLNGNMLYGTTADGGHSTYGTIFRLNTDGSGFTLLYNFTTGWFTNADGAMPQAALVLDGNTLYGTAESGGMSTFGTVFKLQFPAYTTMAPPAIQAITQTNGTIAFTWNSIPGQTYQVEYATDLVSANWCSLGSPITATNTVSTATDPIAAEHQRFYRVKVGP